VSIQPGDVLEFWFAERTRKLWFATDAAFDAEIRSRFGSAADDAARGALDAWAETADAALALVIALDQFPRNLHRGTAAAFAHDAQARRAAGSAIERGFDAAMALDRRTFFYLPFEHSELLADQQRSIALFTRWAAEHPEPLRAQAEDQLSYAVRHHEIIQRFGRFPHRNRVLDRTSTAEELAFLTEPKSAF
jgi:uncharacterized protein (DUF924 family)